MKMFPVCTGINRNTNLVVITNKHVPCMHRDKPATGVDVDAVRACSLYTPG